MKILSHIFKKYLTHRSFQIILLAILVIVIAGVFYMSRIAQDERAFTTGSEAATPFLSGSVEICQSAKWVGVSICSGEVLGVTVIGGTCRGYRASRTLAGTKCASKNTVAQAILTNCGCGIRGFFQAQQQPAQGNRGTGTARSLWGIPVQQPAQGNRGAGTGSTTVGGTQGGQCCPCPTGVPFGLMPQPGNRSVAIDPRTPGAYMLVTPTPYFLLERNGFVHPTVVPYDSLPFIPTPTSTLGIGGSGGFGGTQPLPTLNFFQPTQHLRSETGNY